MLYDTSSLMQCQAKKYSGLNFARKIRPVAPDISSKIWYCGTSIGLTYDGLIASANFCRNRFCPTCQWRRSVKLFRQNYECFRWIKAQYPGCRFIFLTLTVRNVPIDSLARRLVDMSAAWNRFTQRRDFKALGLPGWLRVLEVTRNAYIGTYHPHSQQAYCLAWEAVSMLSRHCTWEQRTIGGCIRLSTHRSFCAL